MDMTWKVLESSAAVIENYIIYDFYAKFFGYKQKRFNNHIITLLFLVVTSLCSIKITNRFSYLRDVFGYSFLGTWRNELYSGYKEPLKNSLNK